MKKISGRPGAKFQQFNLADADSSARYGTTTGRPRLTAMIPLIALARRISPLLGAWLVALSGGRLSLLVARLLRLRRLAGAMLHGGLTPPPPVRLQVETTDVCNLRCIHCKREKLEDMNTLTMPLDAFARTITDIEPFYVTLAGFGEPLIDRTIIDKLSFLHRRDICTSLPTNGTYIRHKREALAAELPNILQLSIDGATEQTFEAIRKRGDFGKIIENYRAICALRADGNTRPHTIIRVFCALQRGNLHDYRAMYRLIGTLRGIDSFGLVPVSHGSISSTQVPARDEVLALHREIDLAITEAQDEDEKAFYRQWRAVSAEWLRGDGRARPEPETNHAPCTVPWFSSYIDAKGRVYPCCYLTGTGQVMGVLNKDGSGFDEIWTGPRYRAFRSDLVSARAKLEGCRACPRNDTKVLSTLRSIRPLLPAADRH
ncbi:MAG TPA: radical SAM protein [Rhizomicrobium sp.]|nr:radical SAM protein [Rhizomicrobium sp.]